MPTTTATLSLNVSAIKALCNGSSVLNGTIAPGSLIGNVGDFYINTTNYVIYGPKNISTFWAASASLSGAAGTSVGGECCSSYAQISSFLFTPTAGFFSASALYINSVGQPSLICNTSGAGNVANFSSDGSYRLAISDDITVISCSSIQLSGNVLSRNTSYFALEQPLDTFRVSSMFISNSSTVSIGSINLLTYPSLSSHNFPIRLGKNIISANDRAVFAANDGTTIGMQVDNGQGTKVAINIPYSSISAVSAYTSTFTVSGSISGTSISCATFYDGNGLKLLTSRQSSPGKLTTGVSTSADIINGFNSLLDALTSHGLII